MFERYTERARRVIFFARYEAAQVGSTTIETEHFLLGLIREDKNITSRYLRTMSDIDYIRNEIAGMAEHAVSWLTRKSLLARTVTIKVRYSDFTTITRSHTAPPTRDQANVASRAVQLLERTDAGRRPVRLLGVSVHNFCREDDDASDPERLPFDAGS